MTIKELAHTAQRAIQARSGVRFTRGHVYEVIAATLEFASLAALRANHVIDEGPPVRPGRQDQMVERATMRARELGHDPELALCAASIVAQAAGRRGLLTRHLDEIVIRLRSDQGDLDYGLWMEDVDSPDAAADDERLFDDSDEPSGNERCSVVLREELERAAAAHDARAHYALALLLGRVDEDAEDIGSAHWHGLQLQGRALSGVEKEWADAWAAHLLRAESARRHLQAAADLDHTHALLDLAERDDDAARFHRAAELGADPTRMAELSYRFDQPHVQFWLTRAAQAGDTGAMRTLIEQFDQRDLVQCWTWVHLAKLLGTDLQESKMRAYHEGGEHDGEDYDDDIGGPLYVAGIEGVELEPIAEAQDVIARAAAATLYEEISKTRATG
jgi:hypothetical protein